MTVRRFLDLLGGHLYPETWTWLDAQVSDERTRATGRAAQEIMAGCMRYGWFVYADEEPDEDKISADLVAAFRYARLQGCEYLLFDCDTIPMEGLPILHPDFLLVQP